MFLSETEYKQVLDLIDEKEKKTPILEELTSWSKAEFGLEIYNYFCDKTKNGLTRLKIVVWDFECERTIMDGANYDKKAQKGFQNKFSSLARKYNIHPEYHDENNIFVCFDTISDQIICKALWSVRDKIYSLKEGDIWKIEILFQSVHIFYETDVQISIHAMDGKSDALREKISNILKKNDHYNVFLNGVSCVFTSHQIHQKKLSKTIKSIKRTLRFGKFDEKANALGILQAWNDYKDVYYERFARKWCAEHNITII